MRRWRMSWAGVFATVVWVFGSLEAVGEEPPEKTCEGKYKGKTLSSEVLKKVLVDHAAWVEDVAYEKIRKETPDERRANLCQADLRGAHLEGANLRGAHLEGTNLYGAQLEGANLASAQLEKADLSGASLKEADLRSAQLEGANLIDAQLKGANLYSVHLTAVIKWERLDSHNAEPTRECRTG